MQKPVLSSARLNSAADTSCAASTPVAAQSTSGLSASSSAVVEATGSTALNASANSIAKDMQITERGVPKGKPDGSSSVPDKIEDLSLAHQDTGIPLETGSTSVQSVASPAMVNSVSNIPAAEKNVVVAMSKACAIWNCKACCNINDMTRCIGCGAAMATEEEYTMDTVLTSVLSAVDMEAEQRGIDCCTSAFDSFVCVITDTHRPTHYVYDITLCDMY